MTKNEQLRQAVVIVHGMGEQRPLDTLNSFIDEAIPGTTDLVPGTDNPVFYSRPDFQSDSHESRYYLARETAKYPQTDFYEYYWAHLMQGNKITDLWETFLRMLRQPPWNVPSGLRVVWGLFWALIVALLWLIFDRRIEPNNVTIEDIIVLVTGGGAAAWFLTWLLTKFIPGKITASFVDVVRYLDSSPRSYAVRRNIRKGMVQFLDGLHKSGRYQRIIVVAHSLGAYVAYDGISYLWTKMNQDHDGEDARKIDRAVLKEFETEATRLLANENGNPTRYRQLQRRVWREFRHHGNPWLITDFVTAGTPMYMADKLMTKRTADFTAKTNRREYAVCPPKSDLPGENEEKTLYTYPYQDGTVLYHAAPFALVRWSNMWFPPHFGLFGDWFGGPLRPLFGSGIVDVPLNGNGWKRFLPAWTHTLYFSFPHDQSEGSATSVLQRFMDLDCRDWLPKP